MKLKEFIQYLNDDLSILINQSCYDDTIGTFLNDFVDNKIKSLLELEPNIKLCNKNLIIFIKINAKFYHSVTNEYQELLKIHVKYYQKLSDKYVDGNGEKRMFAIINSVEAKISDNLSSDILNCDLLDLNSFFCSNLIDDISCYNENNSQYTLKGETLKNECKSLIIRNLQQEINKCIEYFLMHDMKHSNDLGKNELFKMKKELNTFIENETLGDNEFFIDDYIWGISLYFINNIDIGIDKYVDLRKQFRFYDGLIEDVGNFIQEKLLELGNILIKYRYITSIKEHWYFSYDDNFKLNKDLKEKIREYSNIFQKYIENNYYMYKCQEENNKNNILSLYKTL